MMLLLLAAAATLTAGAAYAETWERTITVTGTAAEVLESDVLIIELGVETQAGTAVAALAENSALMEDVFEALREAGLSDDDMRTSQLELYPVYDYGDEYEDEPVMIGYTAVNTVNVSTEMLDSAGAIIDKAVEAGANRIDYVSFGLSPERASEARDRLIEAAVLDARAKADLALEPLGYGIIGVKSVDLDEGGGGWPAFAMAESRSVPVVPGGSEVSARAHVVFLIAKT